MHPPVDQPLARLLPVTAEPPSLADNTADLDRLLRALERAGVQARVPFARMAPLAAAFRQAGFSGHAMLRDMDGFQELVDLFPEGRPPLGMALDLGTTHLEAALVSLEDGSELARGTTENRQMAHGADILSRIHHACSGPAGARDLARAARESIDTLARDLAARAGRRPAEILALAVSGNTTMIHLLLGLDPYHICREPYIPQVNAPSCCEAADLDLCLHARAPIFFLPSVGSYFGGDLISGILAAGLDQAEDLAMLIDVGTNAEVVLGNQDFLVACAGAAGPALEGGVARMGMRAGPGAIERVRIEDGDLRIQVIGHAPPRGLCGSGLIDLVAELYLNQVIDMRGKLRPAGATGMPAALAERLVRTGEGPAFVVARGEDAPVLLGQVDIDAIMRSKAAMYAILRTLTAQVGVEFEDITRIYVAGAFGRHIDPRQAIVLGMLPDLPMEVFQPLGNSSLAGAREVLLGAAARTRAREIAGRITYIELNVNQDFMIRFSGSRFIPHTDPSRFPSVPSFRGQGGDRA